MNDSLNSYLSGLIIQEISGDKLEHLRNSFLAQQPALYIPDWRFLEKERREIIVKNYAGIIFGQNGKIYQHVHRYQEILEFKDIFGLLKGVEALSNERLPFYFGLLSYDLQLAQKADNQKLVDVFHLPDFYLLFPAEALLISKQNNAGLYIRTEQKPLDLSPLEKLPAHSGQPEIILNEDQAEYLKKIDRIRQLIFAGEVYQINYTISLSAELSEQGYSFFNRLYQLNPAPFSAYIRLPEAEIISNSPERFLTTDKRQVVTKPIKGTIKRHPDPIEDQRLADELLKSEKDAAELNMIVDLLRNDLSRVCEPGSVMVKNHRRLESFSNVHHLVSTVEGRLSDGADYIDLLRAAFPGGSISGCPKSAALKFISELEARKRSFYTGSFFIRFPGQDQFDSSVLIRTAILKDGRINFQVGGGIVIDSTPELEWEECMAKADSFLRIIKS